LSSFNDENLDDIEKLEYFNISIIHFYINGILENVEEESIISEHLSIEEHDTEEE
jgi:hypothetical protein